MSDDQLQAVLDRAATMLAEHFDTVQIFVLHRDTVGQTEFPMQTGRGNFYARQAQVREWSIQQDERARIHIRREDEANEASADQEETF